MVNLLEQLNGLKPLSLKDESKPDQGKDDSVGESDKSDSTEKPEKSDKPEKPLKKERKRKTPDATEDSKVKNETAAAATSASASGEASSGGAGDDGSGDKKKSSALPVPEVYPQVLALPMSRRPLFPGFYRPVAITDPQVIKAINELCDKKKPYIGIFLFKDENADGDVITDRDQVHEVGVFAQVTSSFVSNDEMTGVDTMTIIAYPHTRIRIDELLPPKTPQEIEQELADNTLSIETEENEYNPTEFIKKYEVTRVNITPLEDEAYDKKSPVINALTSEILKVFKDISQVNSMFREQIATFSATMHGSTNIFEQPSKLADFCAAICAGEPQELQDVLDSLNIEDRLEKALVVLKKEVMNAELQNKITKEVESKIQKRQREYYLMEQLKGIKRELGIDDGRQKLIDTFKERAEKLKLPPAVQKVFDEEISKLSTLETAMSEFSVTRNYLDWITQLPWGKYTKESFDIINAKKILDEDHYGLADIKDRILEFIAVGNLLGAVDGKIICFVGPPGVGKTSIGKSIARALNRNFFRFSVGGISDVSEIKGHRRTYIGALPGRIIQGLKKTQSQNPLFLIDEIDKVTHGGSQGDPSAALLELLDPEQNSEFLDQYLDIPVDLSKVLFVCTANTLDTIPRPLLDRMEVIELPGYVAEEKVKIAENYLIPLAKKGSGLEDANVKLTTEGVEYIVKHYAKENGVRRLKQLTEKVFRKAAFKVVKQVTESTELAKEQKETAKETAEESSPLETKETVLEENAEVQRLQVPEDFELEITPQNLKEFIGPPIYLTDRLYETTPPGVVMGLAWTSIGGTSMYVEVTAEKAVDESGKPQGGHLSATGQLGDVMKESSKISFSVAKQYVEDDFFKTHNINLHCPEGAVPKDGPSAGITLTTALISLAKNVPLPSIAMTGEITLTGKVLRIGGLKEKLIAAKRNGVTTLFLPKDNQGDYDDLAENLRQGFDVTFVDNYSQIYNKLFK
ncbi:ATP-dependent Lon protease PIM1 [Cyberlindnera jadinii NRRL Y-1542]|uniref:Lon protease homolog, mitochondrial n=1 Tax=Cyberlindnera jadinii (strain ATCC 18201 / CBS 1600 / BCRC 20928 / JCM 3617 / NBRC 0987 / NRRL Y-1542) TaxID=983966 RepID=A0A1E4S0N3_CYBJN|nr:ATP-dependent protease La [Cyberlindnera jadinii NRRL Y-1542]ODV73054.1 ATP-dependent protease La [Cyberlindnera jadinii NRRL Y-1542]